MINTKFGPYLITEQIGAGGMAAVYKAVDERDQRIAAVKILHIYLTHDDDVTKRFRREAEIIRQLDHPHIVRTYDYGQIEGRPYLAMPFLSGGSLAQLFNKPARMSLAVTARLLMQIAGALDYAHEQGIVHRDLKLENILLDSQMRPALADFGIARIMDATRLTTTGQVTGTPLYMSPEQVRGENNLTYSTDIYSLTVMVYLMATGFFPFSGSSPLILLNQHVTMTPPQPTAVNPNLPPALDAVLLKGLAKNPQDRFETAGEFARAFHQAIIVDPTHKINIFAQSPNPILPPIDPDAGKTTLEFGEDEIIPATDRESGKRFRVPALTFTVIVLLLLMMAVAAFAMNNNQQKTTGLMGDATPTPQPESLDADVSPTATLSQNLLLATAMMEAQSLLMDDDNAEATEAAATSATPTGSQTVTASTSASQTQTQTPVSGTSRTPAANTSVTVTRTPSRTPISPTNTPSRTPTRTRTPIPPTNTVVPTVVPSRTPLPPTNTSVPPTPVPPTNVPPTAVPPPIQEPPTAVPPEPPTPVPQPTQDTSILPPLVETLIPPIVNTLLPPLPPLPTLGWPFG